MDRQERSAEACGVHQPSGRGACWRSECLDASSLQWRSGRGVGLCAHLLDVRRVHLAYTMVHTAADYGAHCSCLAYMRAHAPCTGAFAEETRVFAPSSALLHLMCAQAALVPAHWTSNAASTPCEWPQASPARRSSQLHAICMGADAPAVSLLLYCASVPGAAKLSSQMAMLSE